MSESFAGVLLGVLEQARGFRFMPLRGVDLQQQAQRALIGRVYLQDILCEVRVAVLRFKLPEYVTEWAPLLTKYVQRVCERAYGRAQRERRRLESLDALPESLHPQVETRTDGLDDSWFLARVASALKQMSGHHAAAFVLALDGEMAQALQAHGVLPESLGALAERAPLCDKAIGAALGLTPRAVIRARQHAREKLRRCLCER